MKITYKVNGKTKMCTGYPVTQVFKESAGQYVLRREGLTQCSLEPHWEKLNQKGEVMFNMNGKTKLITDIVAKPTEKETKGDYSYPANSPKKEVERSIDYTVKQAKQTFRRPTEQKQYERLNTW